MKKRPTGVTILGTLFILRCVVPGAILLLAMTPSFIVGEHTKWIALPAGVLGMVLFLLGLPGLVVGIGLLRLKNWARLGALGLASFFWVSWVAKFIRDFATGSPLGLLWGALDNEIAAASQMIVLAVLAIEAGACGPALWYFRRPGVKAQFIKAATSDK